MSVPKIIFPQNFLAHITARRARLTALTNALFSPIPRALIWEIGCGHGHFLTHYAGLCRDKYFVGVDRSMERIERAEKKRARDNLENCRFLRCEAREFLHALPSVIRFEEVWVLFPDPWPKKRHHKHRLLQPLFFEALAGRMVEGARLFFRTDHLEYFEEVSAAVRLLKTWAPAPAPADWPLEFTTVFQARARSYHSLVAVRTAHQAIPVRPVAPGLSPLEAPMSTA